MTAVMAASPAGFIEKLAFTVIVAPYRPAFRRAAEGGHVAQLTSLCATHPDMVEEMVSDDNYAAFFLAVKNGHLTVLAYLESIIPTDMLQRTIMANNYAAFREAATNGHLSVLAYIEAKAPGEFQRMIAANDYAAFWGAATNGYLPVLEHLESIVPADVLQRMIMANNYVAFREAAKNGHLRVLEYLEAKAPEEFQRMIAANDYAAFGQAAMNGHIPVLEYLKAKAPGEFQRMIAGNSYVAFSQAAMNGHLPVLEYLKARAPGEFQRMIAANDYAAFWGAATNGRLPVLEYLKARAPGEFQRMIAAKDYAAFGQAAMNGHLPVLEYLEAKAPDEFQRMIAASDYVAFSQAAMNGHLRVLEYLEAKAPGVLQRMIAADNYCAFRWAAMNGHLPVLEYLEAKALGGGRRAIELDDDIKHAIFVNFPHHPIIERLLEHPRVYAYAEMHQREYGSVVNKYTTKLLARLQEQKAAFELSNPTGVFDVDVDKAKQLFYVARHFIRLNTPEAHDELVSLLRIPALRALTHQNLRYTTQNNELLQLALSLNNQQAAQSLLAIPAVRALAEQNNFYRNQARGDLDLHALAQNRESSMTALTQGERQRLQGVTSRYQPLVQSTGVEALMQTLRDALQSRYAANPASIRVQRRAGTELISLPLTWEAFIALGLSASEKKAALKAYYTHKDHTAWRYLSKPNPWLHERASYVYVNPSNHQEKWSTFDEYMELIGMLYLAAKDEGIAPIDGYTLQTRIEQFIAELAFIGRAHNWDKSRPVRDAQGRSVLQEYDDLEGDRPSCYSGTLRRLFQSVLGHPLLRILTPEILDQEINSFVRDRFTAKFEGISDGDHRLIKSAWDKMIAIEDLSEEEKAALRALNIAPAEQETLIQDLTQRWGEQFSRDASYTRKITEAFLLADDEYHLSKFDYVQPETLFRATPPASAAATLAGCSVGTSRDAFFAGTPAGAAVESQSLLTPRI